MTAAAILKKYKNLNKPKKTYLVDSLPEELVRGESILEAANKVLDFKKFQKKQANALKKGKKGKQMRVTTTLKKYKNLNRPKKTYQVNEEDLETIDYNEPQEDLFVGESILNAANKTLDFDQLKSEQE